MNCIKNNASHINSFQKISLTLATEVLSYNINYYSFSKLQPMNNSEQTWNHVKTAVNSFTVVINENIIYYAYHINFFIAWFKGRDLIHNKCFLRNSTEKH